MFNWKEQWNVGIYSPSDALSESHGGGTAAPQAADVQKHFTKNAFSFVSEGKKKGKTAKAASTKTTH